LTAHFRLCINALLGPEGMVVLAGIYNDVRNMIATCDVIALEAVWAHLPGWPPLAARLANRSLDGGTHWEPAFVGR
jgi:hypothetical protein